MKKKRLALVLAAMMALSSAGQTAAVSAAEFTDEVISEDVQEPTAEEAAPEIAEEVMDEEITVSEAPEIFADTEEEDLFSAGTEEIVFGDTEETPVAEEQDEGKALYEGKFISEEEAEHLKETGEEPSGEWQGVEEPCSFTEFLDSLSQKTGILLVRGNDQEGYADMVIPEGLTVIVACGSDIQIKSVTPNGNIYIWENINTPGTLEIREGKGSVTVRDGSIAGMIVGSGSNDTLIFDGYWNHIKGLKGVENVVFSETRNNLEIDGGETEFYNIVNRYREDEGDKSVHLNIEGYNKDTVPVFHNNFDFGMQSDEEGNTWPAGISIGYIKTFDIPEGEEWSHIETKEGSPAVKFADSLSKKDILEMVDKMWVDIPDKDTRIGMDGTIMYWDQTGRNVYGVEVIEAAEGMSAEEIFNRYGMDDFPWDEDHWGADTKTLKDALNMMEAVQETYGGEGYYIVRLPWDANITETLTVPQGVKGIIYESSGDYNEETDVFTPHPAQVTSVSVPEGKIAKLREICNTTEKMNISGKGTAQLVDCRMKQNVTAEGTVELANSVVKSLVCDTLTAPWEYSRIVIGEYLKFNKANLNQAVIYALPEAYLNIGTIDNSTLTQEDCTNIFLGVEGSKKAQVYISGKLDMGKSTYTDNNGEQHEENIPLRLVQCDVAEAKKDGASFTEDCYGKDYKFDWAGEEHYWNNYAVHYTDKEECLGIISSSAAEWLVSYPVIAVFRPEDNSSEVWPVLHVRREVADVFDPEDNGIEGNKYRTAYYDWEKDTWVKSQKYFQVGDGAKESLEAASISTIKTQIYQGKAVTPSVKVTLKGTALKKDVDYTVSYKNNTKAGKTATVTITGKGKYTGTINKNFKISAIPAKSKKVAVGDLKYKVTKSHYKTGEVTVYGATKKTITGLTIPSTVKIDGYTFKVTSIYANAFKSYTKLRKAVIGGNVTSIGSNAFYGCKALKSIEIKTSVLKTVNKNAFKGIYIKAVLKVPSKALKAYQKLLKGKGQSSSVKITK